MTLHPIGEAARLLQRSAKLVFLMDVSRQWSTSREKVARALNLVKPALAKWDNLSARLPAKEICSNEC